MIICKYQVTLLMEVKLTTTTQIQEYSSIFINKAPPWHCFAGLRNDKFVPKVGHQIPTPPHFSQALVLGDSVYSTIYDLLLSKGILTLK